MTDCVEHQNTGPHGYSRVQRGGVKHLAHRLAWADVHGPIPEGMVVRHSCHNRRCINVEHLILGTQADNIRDTTDAGRHHNQKKTHCPKGHEYGPADVRSNGRRQCVECQRAYDRSRSPNSTKYRSKK